MIFALNWMKLSPLPRRAGVVIAALLKIVGVPPDAIVEEYMLSHGAEQAKIREALAGLEDIDSYFPAPHLAALRKLLS